MDFLCSNFCQINDNVVTVKNDVAHTTAVSYMQKKIIIGSNSPEPLAHYLNIPDYQVVNMNSSQT